MKRNYITTALLALGLVTGCVNIQVGHDCKPKHHEGKEADDHEDDKEGKEGKHHDGKESDDDEKEDHEGKDKKGHGESEKEDDDKKGGKDSEAKLKAMAKLSESQARAIAMEKVPNGTIKEGELEKENGKLQWSFDISTPGTKDITEVNIDAITGKILDVSKESPADQAKEGDEEKKEKKEKE